MSAYELQWGRPSGAVIIAQQSKHGRVYVRPLRLEFGFRYELFQVKRGFCFVGVSEARSCCYSIDILDDTQGPSSMGSEAFDEYALRLPSESLSCSYLLVETSNGPSEFCYYRFRREPFT